MKSLKYFPNFLSLKFIGAIFVYLISSCILFTWGGFAFSQQSPVILPDPDKNSGSGLMNEKMDAESLRQSPGWPTVGKNLRVQEYRNTWSEDAQAFGRVLPSRIRIGGENLHIVIREEECYPICINPYITTPSWMAECNHANSYFGISVSDARDMNRGSLSDIIIRTYFNSQIFERNKPAYVYHKASDSKAN